MDRADVIIFGGGLVGLALASALDSSGLSSDRRRSRRSRRREPMPRFDGRTSAVSSSSMRMLDAIGVADHLAEPGCPIRRIAVADGLEPGALAFRSRRRRAARLHAREPPPARGAPRARRGGQEHLADVEIARDRASIAAMHGVVVVARGRPQALRAAAGRRRRPQLARLGRRRGSTSRAGNTTIRRSSRCSATSGRTSMSPTRSSIRAARSRCCR